MSRSGSVGSSVLRLLLIVAAVVGLFFAGITYMNNRVLPPIEVTIPAPMKEWQDRAVPETADSPSRIALNELGGSAIELKVVTDGCDVTAPIEEDKALGCVVSNAPRTIYFNPTINSLESGQIRTMVAHELGHVYQLDLATDFLRGDPAVITAFGEDGHERLADCMAFAKTGGTTSYIESCNDEQVRIANLVWSGVKP